MSLKTAEILINQARSWLGVSGVNAGHQVILDVYNSQTPLPRGHRMTAKEPWCATFVSACAIKTGMADIIPPECSCNKMIILLKALGEWHEDESVAPKPGWIMFYDWDDVGSGDDKGGPEHVGIVERLDGNVITVIEGNYSNSVKRRKIKVNGKTIRGYGVPRYDAAPAVPIVSGQLTHTVVKGEYLNLIAKKYGISAAAIISANKSKYPTLATDPSMINTGWKLIIPAKTVIGIVQANGGLNVREKPTTLSKKITILPTGTKVDILSQADGWGKIEEGYISMQYVKI